MAGMRRRTGKKWMKHFPGGAFLLAALFLAPAAAAQIPDTFTNLKVLPKDISKGELMGKMRAMAGALGLRCNNCHMGGSARSLEGMEFASDEMEAKRTARAMMRMVDVINSRHIGKLKTSRPEVVEVSCATCHRRQSLPVFIEDVVRSTLESEGTETAVARYRELREEHYGGFAYDFSDVPLNSLGEQLGKEGKLDQALAVLALNFEYNPRSVYNRILVGQVQATQGDREAAIATLKQALEIEPDNGWVAQLMQRLQGAQKGSGEEK